MLSRLVIDFLSRSKHLLISWLQLPPAVILEPKKIKSLTVSSVSPSICHEVMGLDVIILVFWMLSFFFFWLLSTPPEKGARKRYLVFLKRKGKQPILSFYSTTVKEGFSGGSDGKESTCNAGDLGLIPGLGRSPGEGSGNPLQCSCLENPMDRGAWWAAIYGVAQSRARLSD